MYMYCVRGSYRKYYSLINKEVPVGMDNWEASLKERRLGKQSWNHRGGWNLQISSPFLPF